VVLSKKSYVECKLECQRKNVTNDVNLSVENRLQSAYHRPPIAVLLAVVAMPLGRTAVPLAVVAVPLGHIAVLLCYCRRVTCCCQREFSRLGNIAGFFIYNRLSKSCFLGEIDVV
jgi:hypothetical protein